jgi:hypothetical protein
MPQGKLAVITTASSGVCHSVVLEQTQARESSGKREGKGIGLNRGAVLVD